MEMLLIILASILSSPVIGWVYMGRKTQFHFSYDLVELFAKYGD